MSLIVTVIDVAGVVVRHTRSNARFNYLTFLSPSDTDDGRYAPAESVQITPSNEQMKELGEWLIKQSQETLT